MSKTSLALCAIVLLAVLAAPAVRAQNAPTALAVVNLSQVSMHIDMKKSMDAEMETLAGKLKQERQDREDEIDKLKKELQAFRPDTDPYRETSEKMLRKGTELEGFGTYAQQKLLLEQRLRTMAMYRAINDAVANYAKSHNILLVLVADDPDLTGARSMEELLSKTSMRKVLYASEALDITTAIIEKMNTEGKTNPH